MCIRDSTIIFELPSMGTMRLTLKQGSKAIAMVNIKAEAMTCKEIKLNPAQAGDNGSYSCKVSIGNFSVSIQPPFIPVSYTHLRAHETPEHLVCRLLLEKKKHARDVKRE
eukprot:TRINITY_DN7626_c0_g1_i7.p1 TRINITY_DN7626_c0_g1~~TRINITY_DN7626_c0_g1_i7.p1  ORF type:complete len:110 (-),score=16.83 TRINITY_DN7626_c0_g1_i7:19-348(-)